MTRRSALAFASCLLAVPLALLRAAEQADRIVIHKARRELLLLQNGKVFRTYKVALGKQPVGAKVQQGDMRTPEGLYRIDGRYARSQYHRALHISYPNESDRARARKLGVQPGGDILIHGLPNGQGAVGKAHLQSDWTWGCVAVTDEEIEEIWKLVPNGVVVEILP
ncbi:L,D-transpeptidase family protein [Paludibaculum fermentans]|uniref:L,D-transpeptidase family protein n=1 Tax=Paludibaculum fermentans TaxID=1473598 RepID=A0A7S7NNN9_PALFE|nr:L,D-transpeptidase family protein [Paludibaculum fermentans]QOY86895.1 L,D-transpeptidase family protein [Paludibaculum fermentans]